MCGPMCSCTCISRTFFSIKPWDALVADGVLFNQLPHIYHTEIGGHRQKGGQLVLFFLSHQIYKLPPELITEFSHRGQF